MLVPHQGFLMSAFKFEQKQTLCICRASEDYFFLLIRPLIITNANVVIKRAKMPGPGVGEVGRRRKKTCLVCKLTNAAERFLTQLF